MKDNLLKISFAPLEKEERLKLEKYFKYLKIFGIALFLIVGGISYGLGFGLFTIIIDILFVVAFVMIFNSFKQDLKDNEKKIWQGILTDKNYTVRRNKDSRDTYTYYFYFGKQKRSVSEEIYNQFNIGDFVEIHLAKRVWGVYFETKTLKENAISPEEALKYRSEHSSTKTKSASKFGCFIFLFIAVLFAIFFMTMTQVIDIPFLREFFEGLLEIDN